MYDNKHTQGKMVIWTQHLNLQIPIVKIKEIYCKTPVSVLKTTERYHLLALDFEEFLLHRE